MSCVQQLVQFKPGTDVTGKGKALAKGRATEKRVVARGDTTTGDLSLVTVDMSPGQSARGQLKAAAAQIQNGEHEDGRSLRAGRQQPRNRVHHDNTSLLPLLQMRTWQWQSPTSSTPRSRPTTPA